MKFGIFCNVLIYIATVYLFGDTVFGALSANVTVGTPQPLEGSYVSLTCLFTARAEDTLNQVVWSFGPQMQGAARIVHWRENEPYIVYYNHGYSSPIYQMTIADFNQGKTVLTINPIELHDAGSYWCNIVLNGTELISATAFIQVGAKAAPTINLYLQGQQEVESGSPIKLFCNYTKSPTDTVNRLSWTHGIQFESSVKIADFLIHDNPSEHTLTYHELYKPPGYEAVFDEFDQGLRGYSSLNIASARIRDGGRYWCTIQISAHIQALINSVDMSVLGIPTTPSPTTTPLPTTKRQTTTTMATTTPTKPTTRKATTTYVTTKSTTTKLRTTKPTTMTTVVTTSPLQTTTKMHKFPNTTNIYRKRKRAHSKIMTGVILAAIPLLVIATCLVCLAICRFRTSSQQTNMTNPVEHGYENTVDIPPKLPPKGIRPKGYEDLDKSRQKRPRVYQRLISSFAMVVRGSVATDDFPEYEYPEPRLDKYELSIVGNTYREYSPVSP